MSGHSKFANIKHKRVRFLQLSDVKLQLLSKKAVPIRLITADFEM